MSGESTHAERQRWHMGRMVEARLALMDYGVDQPFTLPAKQGIAIAHMAAELEAAQGVAQRARTLLGSYNGFRAPELVLLDAALLDAAVRAYDEVAL